MSNFLQPVKIKHLSKKVSVVAMHSTPLIWLFNIWYFVCICGYNDTCLKFLEILILQFISQTVSIKWSDVFKNQKCFSEEEKKHLTKYVTTLISNYKHTHSVDMLLIKLH